MNKLDTSMTDDTERDKYAKLIMNADTLHDAKMFLDEYTAKQVAKAEQLGARMAASSILVEMSPLMVHRLEPGFPEMTAEVIGKTYDEIKRQMKPHNDARAELQQEGE